MKAEEVKEDIVYDKNTEYNYKQLCLIFGEKCCKSGKRTRQFERWRKKYNIIKIPNKNLYKISRITEKQRNKEAIYSCFVSKEDKNKGGVYKIQLHNNIYRTN